MPRTARIRRLPERPGRQRAAAFALSFVASLAALPSAAITYPDVPLQSGQSYPPANVRFILDDSGSMGFVAMPVDIQRPGQAIDGSKPTLTDHVTHLAYNLNTIYYNPNLTYLPWLKADGTRYTGGTDFTAAYNHVAQLTNPIDLSSSTQTFYVPKVANTTSTDLKNYYRFQIYESGGSIIIERSEYFDKKSGVPYGKVGCGKDADWTNCTEMTPTGRSVADELKNFATWYSYYSSRAKVAKGGASEAFSQLGDNIRVGFDTIWNRKPFNIPVTVNDGKFADGNRSTWFERLHGAVASGGTPLHGALQRAGKYFMDSSSTGPWGPESGAAQLSCRQNFAILTTDGYWNNFNDFDSSVVGDADGTDGPELTSTSGAKYQYTPARPYADAMPVPGRSNTLADVAMRYWKYDLRTDLDNNVPTSNSDPAFWQHMVTFAVSIGLKGTLDPNTDLPSLTNGSKVWPNPNDKEDAERIDDLWHASVNGRGRFVVASNPVEFAQALTQALNTIAERTGSASNVTANSTSFQTGTRIYQASYVAGRWTGELAAYSASAAGIADTPTWKASENIPDVSDRNIFTWSGTGGTTFPTATQLLALERPLGPAAVSGADNAAYIKGSQSKELPTGTLRKRDTVLGDIVNSSPAYVTDTNTIYVGANDGMLHAFDADTGVELFAYVPGGINLSHLATLSDPNYSHKYFVDGPIAVSTRRVTPNKNYLVGALGRGGRGVFGLDVTDPTSFGTGDVLWEYRTGEMGQVLGEPFIAKLNNGKVGVVVSNGMNSPGGRAVLYVLDVATGNPIATLDTGVGGDNGLSTPRGWDADSNGTLDYVYAGDLRGNVWKFDLTGTSAGSWSIAYGGSPLFTAQGPAGTLQPITSALGLAEEPDTGRVWVFAGTGRFISTGDFSDTSVQSVYGLIDSGSTISGRAQLQERQITVVGATADGRAVRAFEPKDELDGSVRGWYVDLGVPDPGERVINDVHVRGTALVFPSIVPSESPCEAGGKGYINALDAFTGTSFEGGYFDVDGDGDFGGPGDKIGDSYIGSVGTNGMPTGLTFISGHVIYGLTTGGRGKLPGKPSTNEARRISWREIIGD